MSRSPVIFVSSVTSELGTYRQTAEMVLRACGYQTVHQEIFGLTGATIEGLLQEHLKKCDAAVFLIGDRYGAEPIRPFESYGRLSYTQFEYFEATRLDIPTFLLLTDDAQPFIPDRELPSPEDAECIALQLSLIHI